MNEAQPISIMAFILDKMDGNVVFIFVKNNLCHF